MQSYTSCNGVVLPIAEDAINDGAQNQLGTVSIEHHAVVNAWHGKSILVCLKCMHAFRGFHGQINDREELHGDLVYLNWLEGLWDKHVVCRQGRGFLADMMMTIQRPRD